MSKDQKIGFVLCVIGLWILIVALHYDITIMRFIGNFCVGFGIGYTLFDYPKDT